MQIKNYQCKCGCNDFFMKANGGQMGIYCNKCGKWFKWADKDERHLFTNTITSRPLKSIDPFDIKQAIKNGQLVAFVKGDTIYIRDTQTQETASIGNVQQETKETDTEVDLPF